MSDNLHNCWGTELFVMTKEDKKKYASQSTVNLNDEFKRIVSNTFLNKFHLQGVHANGSSSNVLAIFDATRGDTGRCLIAAGSYLCTTGFVLCNLATSEFHLNSPLSLIREPSDNDELFVKKKIIALPYYIPGTISAEGLVVYEDVCFVKLHEKLILYRAQGQSIMSLFFELMLAGNGAVLSDRALNIIAILSRKHKFTIIIDEIMTGGRTGTLLLLQQKEKNFIECVSHVTLGKWCDCGIVLVSPNQHIIEQRQQDTSTSPRSNSTCIDLTTIIPCWNKLMGILLMADIRRDMVFERMKVKSEDTWGKGALIFSPIKNNTMEGLNHRLLPTLEMTTISRGNMSKPFNDDDNNFKGMINNKIVNTILNWNDVEIYDIYTKKKVNAYLSLIRFLITARNDIGEDIELALSTEDINLGLDRQIKSSPLSNMLSEMDSVGLLKYQKTGAKRLRSWIVSKTFLFN